jgi:hypothetical protein
MAAILTTARTASQIEPLVFVRLAGCGFPLGAEVSGEEAGMDTEGGRWQTVCEPHGYIISHRTMALARSHASCPEKWCGPCSGQVDPETYEPIEGSHIGKAS